MRPKCFYCETELIEDEYAVSYEDEEFDYDKDYIIHSYTCPKCSTEYKTYIPKKI